MKIKGIILILALLLALPCVLDSCSKSGTDNPVDEYVMILDQAAQKAEKINSLEDLLNVQEIISPEAAFNIVRNNADYELTDKDKEKLKKSYDKLLRVAYEKTSEYGDLSEEVKKQTKSQVNLIIEAANKGIDNAKTLGELNGVR